ncbi:MAG: radical SAM protein [Deltaproteobacteria bacterium]|jgi:MoaA/NifB/PqqE/SkfB family radical SAM enzyme|nr:radical SAM protein [Deltaproteobacteria bacterium]
MRAQIKPRLDLFDRLELKDAIPLVTPYVIYIDPCDKCNFQCKFCPTGDRELMKKIYGRNHGLMDYYQYQSLIDEIKQFEDKIKIIRLYKDGEPLLHPRLPEMIRYAKDSGCCEKVDTTTNGSLLNPPLSLKLIEAGLDRINISVEGINASQYADFSKFNLDYDTFVKNITFFYEHRNQCEMNIKINGDNLTDPEKEQFFNTFGNITDGIFIEYAIDYWPTFKQEKIEINQDIGILGHKVKEVKVCPYIFYEMAINSDGTYSMCRFDWKRVLILGRELGVYVSPKKVWNSILLWDLQQKFLRFERDSLFYCAKCGEMKQGVTEDLDEFAQELLEKF